MVSERPSTRRNGRPSQRKAVIAPLLKVDLGCGPNKRPDFLGVDVIAFPGVDIVADLRDAWPWNDASIEEVNCSHFLEHLTGPERVHFANELYRVLITGGKATLVTPHWASNRAYGDPTHQWPPVSEMWFYYLSKEWRESNAPHIDKRFAGDGFDCDFQATWGYAMNEQLLIRNQEYQQFALQNYKEAALDMIAAMIKR